MKYVEKKKKIVLLMLSVILILVMNACSYGLKEEEASLEDIVEPKTIKEKNTEIFDTNAVVNDEKLDSATEEIAEGDPIVAMVERYEDNIIVLRDLNDEDIIYYFSTQNAQVIEGISHIAAGDIGEITYRGVQGDKENPGEAVKVVAESMMYK